MTEPRLKCWNQWERVCREALGLTSHEEMLCLHDSKLSFGSEDQLVLMETKSCDIQSSATTLNESSASGGEFNRVRRSYRQWRETAAEAQALSSPSSLFADNH